MRLTVTTPLSILIDVSDVSYVLAEDDTGSFGILPGHADFMTLLSISVITWRNSLDKNHFLAVRGGILKVRNGQKIEIATREAASEDELARLGDKVLKHFRQRANIEEKTRFSSTRLQVATLMRLQRYVGEGRQSFPNIRPPLAPDTGQSIASVKGKIN